MQNSPCFLRDEKRERPGARLKTESESEEQREKFVSRALHACEKDAAGACAPWKTKFCEKTDCFAVYTNEREQ